MAACRGSGRAPSERCRSRDINPIAKDVVILHNDVAEIDPDPEPDAAVPGDTRFAVGHRPLNFSRTTHRVDHAGEFGQHAVAGVLHDPAVVLGDLWIDQFSEVGLEPLVRALLVRAHQARIARHISGEDRGKTPGGDCSGGNNSRNL